MPSCDTRGEGAVKDAVRAQRDRSEGGGSLRKIVAVSSLIPIGVTTWP